MPATDSTPPRYVESAVEPLGLSAGTGYAPIISATPIGTLTNSTHRQVEVLGQDAAEQQSHGGTSARHRRVHREGASSLPALGERGC